MSRQKRGGFLIAKVHQAAGRVFARMLREHGTDIHPAQGRILFVLWQEGAMPLGDLAKKVSLNKSTLTNAIDRLEEAGEVVRVRSDEDRRRIDVCLTDRSRKTRKLYEDVSAEMSKLFYRDFDDAEITRFEHALERILANLE